MHNARLVNPELHLACLGVLHGRGHIGRHGTNLRVGHQAAWAQNLAQSTHHAHGIGSCNHHIKRHVARLDLGSQIIHANYVSTSSLGFISLGALGKYGHTFGFSGSIGQHHGTTHHLVGFLGIHPQLHRHVDGLIEFGGRTILHQRQGFSDRIQTVGINLALQSFLLFGQFGHITHPPQLRPSNGQSRRWCERLHPDRRP